MRVLPDVGLSKVSGPPLALAAVLVLCKFIHHELTSRPEHRETENDLGISLGTSLTRSPECCANSESNDREAQSLNSRNEEIIYSK